MADSSRGWRSRSGSVTGFRCAMFAAPLASVLICLLAISSSCADSSDPTTEADSGVPQQSSSGAGGIETEVGTTDAAAGSVEQSAPNDDSQRESVADIGWTIGSVYERRK